MNPLENLTPYIRAGIYLAAILVGALTAGYAAIGGLPDWLVFAAAFIGALTGGTALSNLDTSR